MPASTSRGGGRLAPGASRIAWMLARVASGSWPRRPSLAPVSTTSTATGWRSSQSMRRSAPAEVSPLTPALTTR